MIYNLQDLPYPETLFLLQSSGGETHIVFPARIVVKEQHIGGKAVCEPVNCGRKTAANVPKIVQPLDSTPRLTWK